MRISDWSSDVCSSDLSAVGKRGRDRLDREHPVRGDAELRAPRLRGDARLSLAAGPERRAHRAERGTVRDAAVELFQFRHNRNRGSTSLLYHAFQLQKWHPLFPETLQGTGDARSEERRVGKEWVSTCRFRESPS